MLPSSTLAILVIWNYEKQSHLKFPGESVAIEISSYGFRI
jgi:hypothetical protein